MSVKSEQYYWLECDGLNEDGTVCGEKSTEGGDFSAWSDLDGAEAEAEGRDWDIRDGTQEGKHYCPEHQEEDEG